MFPTLTTQVLKRKLKHATFFAFLNYTDTDTYKIYINGIIICTTYILEKEMVLYVRPIEIVLIHIDDLLCSPPNLNILNL